MKNLEIDIETYSAADLPHTGVYRYCEDPSFDILLLGYCVDDGDVHVIDLTAGEEIPEEIIAAFTDPNVTKWAFNCAFERVCISRWMKRHGYPLRNEDYAAVGDYLNPQGWRCTMVWSAYLGLPLSLAGVGTVLGLEKQKLETGKDLIRVFCKPGKDGSTRKLPHAAPEKWRQFILYNERDVVTEMEIKKRLSAFPVPEDVWQQYCLDQQINDRGILIDTTLVGNAIRMDTRSHETLTALVREMTHLENPSSVQQMKRWLCENGLEVESLGKKQVTELIRSAPEPLKDVLSLRLQLSKSSVKKYIAMQTSVCSDDRIRGCFQFYGASRTGRFSGKLVQFQNLFRNTLPDLDAARTLARNGDYDTIDMLYGSVPDVLSELIRTAIIAPEGKQLYVADFSAIEARVIAWMANEQWRQEVFAGGGDIYCASASQMFGVPVEKHGINGHLRQKGKIAELALGYGGSVGALTAMGALEMGLHEEELLPLVRAWRDANPNIVRFWWDVDTAAMAAVADRRETETHSLHFERKNGLLLVTLPSGRQLSYVKPVIGTNKFGSPALTYMGTGVGRRWERLETYGPKLCENIIQAIARDILCHAMQNLSPTRIVAHVHDEVILEADEGTPLGEICATMSQTPAWAKGLELRADGYCTPYYKKD